MEITAGGNGRIRPCTLAYDIPVRVTYRRLTVILNVIFMIFLAWSFSACGIVDVPNSSGTYDSSEAIVESNGLNESSGLNGPDESEEPEETFEIIRDLGREIIIAAGWPYPPTEFSEQIRRISQEYNIILTTLNIEYSEIMPNLEASVMAGRPFADMVLLSGEMVLPAITGNLIYALEEFVPPEADVWGPQEWVRPSGEFLGFHWIFAPYALETDGTFLGVNLDIIRAIGATDPVILYENGQWDFYHFMDIMIQARWAGYYGISGVPGDIIGNLIGANDGYMVYNFRYGYDNPKTMRALNFAYRIFRTERLWMPGHGIYNWHGNFFAYLEGRSAFFPLSEWALQQDTAGFDFAIVPFPRGPDNATEYTFIRGFSPGVAVPRWTWNPDDVYTVFEGLSQWGDAEQRTRRDRDYLMRFFPRAEDGYRAVRILQNQGKFDLGMAIPTFNWVNGILAEGFYNGTMTVPGGVERFRNSQQSIIDQELQNWIR